MWYNKISFLKKIKICIMKKISKYSAFTLAEILIVLGIIGIVAEMTIPTLMNNVQKQVYETSLKKFYATQSDGWSRMLANEGVESLEDTEAFQAIPNESCTNDTAADLASCETFFNDLKKYFRFNLIKKPANYSIFNMDGTSGVFRDDVIVLSDGSIIPYVSFEKTAFTNQPAVTREQSVSQIRAAGGHMFSFQGDIWIDVNGFKKPNTWGKDIFSFLISGDGKLFPELGKDASILLPDPYWKDDSSYCGSAGNADISKSGGWGCSARIMENGWVIDYKL